MWDSTLKLIAKQPYRDHLLKVIYILTDKFVDPTRQVCELIASTSVYSWCFKEFATMTRDELGSISQLVALFKHYRRQNLSRLDLEAVIKRKKVATFIESQQIDRLSAQRISEFDR
jgi:hypothetical protein